MVLALDVVHARAFDVEHRHTSPVLAADLDVAHFAAAQEPEGAEKQIVRLKHVPSLVDCGRRGGILTVDSR